MPFTMAYDWKAFEINLVPITMKNPYQTPKSHSPTKTESNPNDGKTNPLVRLTLMVLACTGIANGLIFVMVFIADRFFPEGSPQPPSGELLYLGLGTVASAFLFITIRYFSSKS